MTNQPTISAPDGRSPGHEVWADQYLPQPYQEPQAAGTPLVDTAWIRGALFRQRWLIGVTLVLALVGGLIVTLLATPIYEAESSVRISPFGNSIVDGQQATAAIQSTTEVDLYMQTQATVVESRKIASEVASSLNPSSINALLGSEIDSQRPPDQSDEEWLETKRSLAVSALQGGVRAEVPGNQSVILISFRSPDPVLAAEVTNAYTTAYIRSDSLSSVEKNQYAREYLIEQIDNVRGRLSEAEKAANAYARASGIVTTETTGNMGETGQTITGANLTSINQTVAQARAARIAAEQKWRAVQGLPAAQLPEVQANAAIQQLTAEKARLSGELTNLRERYTDEFPAIVDVRSRIDLIDQQIASTAANIKSSVRNEFLIAQRQEAALEGELGAVTSEALVEQDDKIEFTNLERNAQALRGELEQLLMRYNQITTAANAQSGSLTLLDSAIVPDSPISPSLPRNLFIALVLGLVAAGGLGLVREVFVDQFRRAEDIENRLGLPLLGVTPHVQSSDLESNDSDTFSALMEAYASIRSTIDYNLPESGAVLQLTSSRAGEGKSTTAVVLAELFARLGRKTLLIDADLRKPSISKLLEIDRPAAGLSEVLQGKTSFEDARLDHVHDNLSILAVAQPTSDPVALLSSYKMHEFLEQRRKEYSLILIDSSPVLGLADAPQIAKIVDATIFVVEANSTSFAQASSALKRLQYVGARVSGGVLSKYRALEAGEDYDYHYTYYRYGEES